MLVQPSSSRRLFLKQTAALSTLGAASPLAINLAAVGQAAAQNSPPDYKALVCIFLLGGNDAYNTVLPTDPDSWEAYKSARNTGAEPIALPLPGQPGGVLPINPINPQGRSFALHPRLDKLQSLFNNKRLAIVPNVGPLVAPTSKSQFSQASHIKPANLFSHNDQQNMWQSFEPEGSTKGWGGLLADLKAADNTKAVFSSISASGSAVWLSGEQVRQYQVGIDGAIHMGSNSAGQVYGSTAVANAMKEIVQASRDGYFLERDLAKVNERSISAEADLSTTLAGTAVDASTLTPMLSYTPDLLNPGKTLLNPLAQQLHLVARMAKAAGTLGVKRQVFFVSMGGFDTHDAQNSKHADLMARLDHAMNYFNATLVSAGLHNNVTTFTASEFGRTFTSNGDGTDHGWGGHHFVMGGAVKGGDLYGTFPQLGKWDSISKSFASDHQVGNGGSLLPTTSVDQLGATLARWFGVTDTQDLNRVFKNLGKFSQPDLGFMS